MESLGGFLSAPHERGFFRPVEVEKALRNAGGTWLSLISAPARMGLFVRTLPGHRPAGGMPPGCLWWHSWPAPEQPWWTFHHGPHLTPSELLPAMKPTHQPLHRHRDKLQKAGGRAQLLSLHKEGENAAGTSLKSD